MATWNFKVNNSPKAVGETLAAALGSVNGLEFHLHTMSASPKSISFRMRKKILYAWYLVFMNSVVVNGQLTKRENTHETDVKISFNQHFLWKLVIFTYAVMGLSFLVMLLQNVIDRGPAFIIIFVVVSIGLKLYKRVQKKYQKNIQEYKTLISGVLNS